MAKKKVVEEVGELPEGAGPVSIEAEADVKPAKASRTEVTVKYRDHKGEVAERTFSKEVHGEDFAELAEEFKSNPNNKIVE